MSHREVMQQALDALKFSAPKAKTEDDDYAEQGWREHFAAIDALRAALAEPVQEPVAWRVLRSDGQYELYFVKASAKRAAECYISRPQVEPLYTHPAPQRQPQEPMIDGYPLWSGMPQRQPLPKHDQHCVDVPGYGLMAVKLVRAVERAHGIGGQDE